MISGARRALLRVTRPLRVHFPAGARPSLMLRRAGDRWGVALLHGGKEVWWAEPAEARAFAGDLVTFAALAAKPGTCPGEHE